VSVSFIFLGKRKGTWVFKTNVSSARFELYRTGIVKG
jgi:hypothetical protein